MSNKVDLIGIYGDDTTIASSAWYSTSQELTPERIDRIPEFIKKLAVNKHTSPFESNLISFKVTADIATHIHCLKHRIGVSINSQSQRYQELKYDDMYIPDDWPEDLKVKLVQFADSSFEAYHNAVDRLIAHGLSRSRAKESARFFLQYNTQITWKMTFNLLSFVHFQNLRNSTHAQKEIREIAESMLQLVMETGNFNHSLHAFGLIVT